MEAEFACLVFENDPFQDETDEQGIDSFFWEEDECAAYDAVKRFNDSKEVC